LKLMVKLTNETNVQLVLKELQTYVTWQSQPKFVQSSVQAIASVALKVPSVADACLRGLVKMLDSKCEALSTEAVVSLRALLQQRQKNADSGLGSVLPHLVRYLDDLSAPSARASVVWIIGQYQNEVPRLAPDVVRKLAKTFVSERQEVKQQVLGLSLKVWAFHALNAKGQAEAICKPVASGAAASGSAPTQPAPRVTPEESTALLPRLEAMVDYIGSVAALDPVWDVRDMARAISKLKANAKQAMADGTDSDATATVASLAGISLKYCRSAVAGTPIVDASAEKAADSQAKSGSMQSTWLLGSLAQSLDFPLESYRELPNWATENSSDDIRKQKVEPPPIQTAPKFISSDNVGNSQNMERRVQNPSNIANLPQVSNLADIDLFYSEETPLPKAVTRPSASSAIPVAAPAPSLSLEQIGLVASAGSTAPVGKAVFGEDDESSEESDDDGDDWKYCGQAPAAAPAAVADSFFQPPPREVEQAQAATAVGAAAAEAEQAQAATAGGAAAAEAPLDLSSPMDLESTEAKEDSVAKPPAEDLL